MLELAIAAARTGQFLSGAILFGTPALLLYAFPQRTSPGGDFAWVQPFVLACGLITALATLTGLALQTVSMAGSVDNALAPGAVDFVLLHTGFGLSSLIRAIAALLAAVCMMIVRPHRRAWAAASALGGAALASIAWGGHGVMDDGLGGLIHLGGDVVHLTAAGIWIGALAGFSSLLMQPQSAERQQGLHIALTRFSGAGTLAVLLLLATGLINSWFLVSLARWPMLFTTLYGKLLLLKLGLFIAMIVVAAVNRFVLTPRLGQAASGDKADLTPLRVSIFAETLAGAAVLAVVSLLGVLAPIAAQ